MKRVDSPDAATADARRNSIMLVTSVSAGEAEWDAYVSNAPGGSFYHLSGWRPVMFDSMGHESFHLVARDGGGITGVLPLVLVSSRLFGRILASVPFMNYGGICADNQTAATALLDEAASQARRLKVDYLELRSAVPWQTDLPVSLRKISMTLQLDPDPDRLWSAFSSKHRNNIRRVQKNDLHVTSGGAELLPVFYSVMEQSWRALGTPFYSRDFFGRIIEQFGDLTRIFVCWQGGVPVAVAFNGYFNGTVEGMWAGTRPDSRDLHANYVLYWEMIRDACQRGCVRYHLGRSTADSASEQFKKKWNATASQLYWYYYLPDGGPMPSLNVDNPKYRLAIQAWRRLPLWLLRQLGPRIAPLIP